MCVLGYADPGLLWVMSVVVELVFIVIVWQGVLSSPLQPFKKDGYCPINLFEGIERNLQDIVDESEKIYFLVLLKDLATSGCTFGFSTPNCIYFQLEKKVLGSGRR